jgi:hypothetical protein
MNRTLKLTVTASIAEMTLLAAAVLGWKARTLGGLDPAHLHQPFPVGLVFFPFWVAVCSLYLYRRLTSDRPRISDSHRRFIEAGLMLVCPLTVALHGWTAYVFLHPAAVAPHAFWRILTAFTGAYTMVHGNFAAKLDPPTGDGAPSPAVWTRTLLRTGWAFTVIGLAIIVCALTLPRVEMLRVLLAVSALGIVAEVGYRRMTRPTQPA